MKYILSVLLFIALSTVAIAEEPRIYSYTVKGVIKKLPAQDSAKKTIMIKHEKIPDYVGAEGTVVGMNAMTMPFGLSDKVSLEDLKEGDCIIFNFDSWWGSKPADQINKIEKIKCE